MDGTSRRESEDSGVLNCSLRRWLWAVGCALLLFSASGCRDYFLGDLYPPTSVYLHPPPSATPTHFTVEPRATTAGEVVQELAATPEPTPAPATTPEPTPLPLPDPCVLLPEEPNREITTSTAGRACWADYYTSPGDQHSWIGGIKLDRVQDAATAQRLLENGLDEGWQWRPAEGWGNRAYEFDTDKTIAYHLRFQRGPFTIQVQALEGKRESLRDLAEVVDGQILIHLGG